MGQSTKLSVIDARDSTNSPHGKSGNVTTPMSAATTSARQRRSDNMAGML